MLPSRIDRVGVAVIAGPPHRLPLPLYDNRVTLFGPVVRKEFAHLFIAPDFLTALRFTVWFCGRRSPLTPYNGWLLTLDHNHVLIPQHPPSLSECRHRKAEQRQDDERKSRYVSSTVHFRFGPRGSTASGRQWNSPVQDLSASDMPTVSPRRAH